MCDGAREERKNLVANETLLFKYKSPLRWDARRASPNEHAGFVSALLFCDAATHFYFNRACSVPRGARGLRGWGTARPGSTALPGYAWHVLWERTARARATGIRCRAPPGSSARWWGRRRAPLAPGGTFAPGSVGLTQRRARRAWCAAETCLPRLISGVLLVSKSETPGSRNV